MTTGVTNGPQDAGEGVVVLAGPTASGKSALALAIAKGLAESGRSAVLINADSMQVYRELRLLTARPDAADAAQVPHRLYGVMSAETACSVAQWRALALTAVEETLAASQVPIVVGGSGLYIRAFLKGLSPMPDISPAVRAAARARYGALGEDAFRAALAERDPAAASRIAAGDQQRLIRAWEVVEASGRPFEDWRTQEAEALAWPALKLLLLPGREELYAACDARLKVMFEAGALEEVAALMRVGMDPSVPAMKALGVEAIAAHLVGEINRDEALRRAKQATRRYAKRQLTWFRHQYAPDITLPPGPDLEVRALAVVDSFLLTADRADTSLRAL
ncbi:MAG: tRNA (adenosine(37)-N6)-dimethylallyltransferase MiaA [Alphaproteobacteria bacterium]|jgi:tRNA dimethylallyltransferase|nr:tRNA (adenosine(37)-N6)-dimethylallyltransferase MiaA [Alphaproteobacteria bacterium]